MTWQRARQPSQKAERIGAILAAAGELFDQKDLSEISMRDLAETASLSKASLYSYFKTKEEVFATLFLRESEIWFGLVEPKLKRLRTPSASRVAFVLTEVLRECPRFCRLTAVLASVLERNLSTEFLLDFKTELNANLAMVVAALQRVFPAMTDRSGAAFLYQHQAVLGGLWPLTHPSPDVAKVLSRKEYQGMRFDFHELFRQTLQQLLAQYC